MSSLSTNTEVEEFVNRNLTKQQGILNDGVVSVQYLSQSTYIGYVDDQNQKQGKGVYRYSNDDVYCGEWKNDHFHGHGAYLFENGTQFRGFFQNGQSIKGMLKEKHGSTYEGDFQNGYKNGFGKMHFNNGSVYEGYWKQDKPFGQGKLYKKDYEIDGIWDGLQNCSNCNIKGSFINFKGSIIDNNLNGRITIEYGNGSKYEGLLKNSLKNGQGTYTFNYSNKYSGQFKCDRFDGWGKLQTENSQYQGMFMNSLPHGYGKLYQNGSYYEGQWILGQKEGKGKMVFPNGDVYEGQFLKGFKHGHGVYNYSNSIRTYIGEFKQDQCNGSGKLKDQMKEYEGLFKSNRICKNGGFQYSNPQPPSIF